MIKDVPRQPGDGRVEVNRYPHPPRRQIQIAVVTEGITETLTISEFNARRVLAMLSLVLELPLSKAAQKGIVL